MRSLLERRQLVLSYTVTTSPAQRTGTAGKAGEFTATKLMIVVD